MEPTPHAQNARRRAVRWVATLIVVVLVVWFASDTLRQGWRELSSVDITISFSWCALSAALYGVGLLPMAFFWWLTLRSLGQQPAAADVFRGYYLGHLGKYVPGKALVVVLRTGLLTAAGCDLRCVAASVFIETLTFMATGAAIAAVLLVTAGDANAMHIALALALAVVVGLPVTPTFARFLVRRLDSTKDKDSPTSLNGFSWKVTFAGIACSAIAWTLLGLSLWAAIRALGVDSSAPLAQLALWVKSVTLPYVAGFLSLIPGGLFVRDALLVELLTPQIPAETALIAATLWRIISLASEVGVCAIISASRLRLATK